MKHSRQMLGITQALSAALRNITSFSEVTRIIRLCRFGRPVCLVFGRNVCTTCLFFIISCQIDHSRCIFIIAFFSLLHRQTACGQSIRRVFHVSHKQNHRNKNTNEINWDEFLWHGYCSSHGGIISFTSFTAESEATEIFIIMKINATSTIATTTNSNSHGSNDSKIVHDHFRPIATILFDFM